MIVYTADNSLRRAAAAFCRTDTTYDGKIWASFMPGLDDRGEGRQWIKIRSHKDPNKGQTLAVYTIDYTDRMRRLERLPGGVTFPIAASDARKAKDALEALGAIAA